MSVLGINTERKYNTQKLVYDDSSKIFKFIKPNENDQLSKMSGLDLQYLIMLIDEYYIELKNSLGFAEYVTFGLELEFENAIKERISRQLKETFTCDSDSKWALEEECSLFLGAEIKSPILRDEEKSWVNLDKVCEIVKKYASIDKKAGAHIHIGTQTLGNNKESWLNFIKIWSVYENIIFRFAYGEYLTARPYILKYAEPLKKDFWNDYKKLKSNHASLNEIIERIKHQRNQAVNFNNVSYVLSEDLNKFSKNNTIEFRCPNGTLNPVVWQNNVNFFVHLLNYSRSPSFNDDIVEQRHKIDLNKFSELIWYDEIYLEQALELCDMIFTNNFDKVYFLRQYLKSFQVCKQSRDYQKAPEFTKKGIKKIKI